MRPSLRIRVCLPLLFVLTVTPLAVPQDAVTARNTVLPLRSKAVLASSLLELKSLPDDWREHPLAPALFMATRHFEQMRNNVKDFTCVLVKRERINGRLGGYEFLATKVRHEAKRNAQMVTPFSVFIKYLGPSKVRGRKVLYVEGENDNKMIVRNGGQRFRYLTLRLSPDSEAASRQSRYPITELGLTNVVRRLIEQAQDDMRSDPAGANTEVTFFRDAKVGDRSCTHIQVVHPRKAEALEFHLANIFVDDELNVPLRVEGYDWPEAPGEEPPLLEEYTYTKLHLNAGLTDADFRLELVSPRTSSR